MNRNIDIDLLRAFVTIYETGTFSHAAERLGRTQSTISQQIKKLEEILEREVFDRSGRKVSLSTHGEVLLLYARQMLRLNDEIVARVVNPDIEGTVRFGTPEAFAATHLPEVVARFAKSYPSVALEVNCDLTQNLLEGYKRGDYDIILIKRDATTRRRGRRVWHESLVWVAANRTLAQTDGPLPLVLSPHPCIYRQKALAALEKAGRDWRAVYTSHSLAGRIAAVKAGLGVAVMPKDVVPRGLFIIEESRILPKLEEIEIALLKKDRASEPAVERLAEHITFCLESDPVSQVAV